MAAELDAFLGELVEIGQAHHLIAAAVGQDRRDQFMKEWRPPSRAIRSAPGRSIR
jgi:hypothetical protein